MQRVAILGAGGAGKPRLARALSDRTGLPVAHLDVLYRRPGWKPPPEAEFRAALDAVVVSEVHRLRSDADVRRFLDGA